MEKMDMAWCSIWSNLILPISFSPSPSVTSTPDPTPRGQTQASPAGGEADRQQGYFSQTFASHCMPAFCTSRQQHNECHMSNGATLPLTYGNSVIYGNAIVVFWLMFLLQAQDVCSYVLVCVLGGCQLKFYNLKNNGAKKTKTKPKKKA